ncbi:alpha/beta hydrolase family protein [Sphingobium ummariense]
MSQAQASNPDLEALAAILGPELAHFAPLIPQAMAQELLRDDRGFIARHQLGEALLARLRPEMRHWTTPDVLRTLDPRSPFARNRMQAVAGALAPVACRAFPGFCYYPYVPFGHVAEGRSEAPLIVAVHGSSRNPKDLRDAYATFAERLGCFVLAPLFPLDLTTRVPDEEYKQLVGDRVRYDRLLWAMVEELAAITTTRFSRILLFGFSGGAQFAQRLLHVDPGRLDGVALGAPTYVTLPDRDRGWWSGIGDFERLFGKPLDFEAMRSVPVQLLCGSADELDCDIYDAEEMGLDAAAYAGYGRNRQQRIAVLARAWARMGIPTEQVRIEGAGHAFLPLLEASKPFFERILLGAGVP